MKATSKKFFFVLLSTLFVFSMLFPVSALADEPQSTLGDETPYMYCAFLDANGKQADGNALVSGDYTVNVIVSDMAHASILQFTAVYDSSVITDLEVTGTVADDANSGFTLGGIKDENDILVVALASEENNYSALDANGGTSIATMDVTVDAGEGTVDFEDVFTFSDDPDLTFLEADYADGYDDAYVTDTTAATTYNTYEMIADASPEFLTISAKVVIADDLTGNSGAMGIGGIKIYTDVNYDPVATTAADGTFTALVPRGTNQLIISGFTYENGVKDVTTGSTINRTVTISGKGNIADEGVIPIIVCDYNADGYINITDYTFLADGFGTELGDNNYNRVYDLNSDSYVNITDYTFLSDFIDKVDTTYEYPVRELVNED